MGSYALSHCLCGEDGIFDPTAAHRRYPPSPQKTDQSPKMLDLMGTGLGRFRKGTALHSNRPALHSLEPKTI